MQNMIANNTLVSYFYDELSISVKLLKRYHLQIQKSEEFFQAHAGVFL